MHRLRRESDMEAQKIMGQHDNEVLYKVLHLQKCRIKQSFGGDSVWKASPKR